MAYIYEEVSRTFSEYLLIPNLTTEKCTPDNIDLSTPLVKFKKDEECSLKLNINSSCMLLSQLKARLKWLKE